MGSRSVVRNSAIARRLTATAESVRTAAAESRLVRRLRGSVSESNAESSATSEELESEDDPADSSPFHFPLAEDETAATNDESNDTADVNDESPTWRSTSPATTGSSEPTHDQSESQLLEGSTFYSVLRRGRQLVSRSWAYRWLTAEPRVIVIDLRTTRVIGPILEWLDRSSVRARRDLVPAISRSTLTQARYWLQGSVVDRPIRVVSIAVATVANLGLLAVLATGGEPLGPATFVLLAALLLAARGIRSTASWDELLETI